ncbi:MAG: hypothetical protein FWB72_03125 [Firmicutes bacterium]|nr:hypothetical protein [Bacillota bacterium]
MSTKNKKEVKQLTMPVDGTEMTTEQMQETEGGCSLYVMTPEQFRRFIDSEGGALIGRGTDYFELSCPGRELNFRVDTASQDLMAIRVGNALVLNSVSGASVIKTDRNTGETHALPPGYVLRVNLGSHMRSAN